MTTTAMTPTAMTTTDMTPAAGNVPTIWSDARDVSFFRITAGLSTFEFRLGAGLLLAGYDDTAGVGNRTRAERDLIPVRVRRTR